MMDYLHKFSGGWTSHFGGRKRRRLASPSKSSYQSDLESAPSVSAGGTIPDVGEHGLPQDLEAPSDPPIRPNEETQASRLFTDAVTQTSVHRRRSVSPDQCADESAEEVVQPPASAKLTGAFGPTLAETSGIAKVMHGSTELSALVLTDRILKQLCRFVEESRELERLTLAHTEVARDAGAGQATLEHTRHMINKETDYTERTRLIRFLEERELGVTSDTKRMEEMEELLATKRKYFYWHQDDLRCSLEPPLLAGGLLELRPAESDNMEWTTQKGHKEAWEEAQDPPDTAPSDDESISEEEYERRIAKEELDQAADNLNALNDEHENWSSLEQSTLLEYKRGVAAGEAAPPIEEMHNYLLQQKMELTRALIEAEEWCDKVAARARALGLLGNAIDQESHFVDYLDDGENESIRGSEDGQATRRAFIEAWREDIPESLQEVAKPDVDDWDARTIKIGDSLSEVDYTRNRKRIDRWRFICDSCGAEGDCGALGKDMIDAGQ